MIVGGIVLLIFSLGNSACSSAQSEEHTSVKLSRDNNPNAAAVQIPTDISWGERMARSVMKRNEKVWQMEGATQKKWSYTNGLVSLAFLKLWKQTGDKQYFDYAKTYADDLIDAEGKIYGYEMADFNIDKINSGKMLFPLFAETGDERYQTVMNTLRRQVEWQPRNTMGGFWHKRRYPWQMWLDGLYMGAPFYAQYALEYKQPEAFEDIANQFILIDKYARDEKTGLLYHGWDESRVQEWANPETGCSPHFWGRALGWYTMALVDVLDYFPEDHPRRLELLDILKRLSKSIVDFQDEESGLWYQVVNFPEREGNYKEATVTAMMAYSFAKAARKGYLDESYYQVAEKAFNGLVENLVEVTESGEIHLHKCCAVAGLGGSPYRDGTYDYYVKEKIRSNDAKGMGPFIMASIELEFLKEKSSGK